MNETMAHTEVQGLFGALLDGELPTSQAATLHTHLGACEECRTGYDRYARAVVLVRETGREHAPAGFARAVLRRVRRRRRAYGPAGSRWLEVASFPSAEVMIPVCLAAAAAAVLVLAAP